VSRSKVDAATVDDSGGTPVTAPGYPGPAHVPPPRNRRSEPA
jgi:hypothetical protein